MTQAQTEPKLYNFDEFISWYPENSEVRYELHDGVIIEMPKPKGKHSNLTGSLIEQLLIIIRLMGFGGIFFLRSFAVGEGGSRISTNIPANACALNST